MPDLRSALPVALRALVAVQRALPGAPGAAVRDALAAPVRERPDERADERAIDALRRHLAACADAVEVVDFGAGRGRPPVRTVAEVYARAASGPAWGRVLYRLVRARRAHRVLELGTNLGVSAAHLAAALARTEAETGAPARLVTLEGAPALAALARRHLAALGHDGRRVDIVEGPFAETLADVCAREGPFEVVFVDGHHEEAAALAYVGTLRAHLAPGALVVLDDCEPGRPVRRAFRALAAEAAGALGLGRYGLLAFAPVDVAPPPDVADSVRGAARALVRPTPS